MRPVLATLVVTLPRNFSSGRHWSTNRKRAYIFCAVVKVFSLPGFTSGFSIFDNASWHGDDSSQTFYLALRKIEIRACIIIFIIFY